MSKPITNFDQLVLTNRPDLFVFFASEYGVNKVTNEPQKCKDMNCDVDCKFAGLENCKCGTIDWLNSEYRPKKD